MDFKTMKPRQVEAYLREKVRQLFGDEIENKASIFAANGYYSVSIEPATGQTAVFMHFRKTQVPKIIKAMKALAE